MKRFGNLTKKLVPLFLVGAMILPITLPTDAAVKNDYQNHWAKKTIQEWIDKGYIKGVGDQGVLPNKEISRAEFVRMVNLRFGYNKPAESNKFTDVKAGSWYYNDVMYALKQGYIAGISETQFGPKMMVSREQAGTIVARIADVVSDEEGLKVFKDADKFAKYAKGPIGAAAKLKIISGYEDKTFRPKKVLTRAEAMVLLEKSYETVQKEMEKKEKEAKKEFKVTFDSDGGSKVEPQIVKKGQKVQKPKDPTKKDFVFDGWYLDGKKFDFDTIIDRDITLKAKWDKPSGGGGGGGGSSSGGSGGGGGGGSYTPPTKDQALDDVIKNAINGNQLKISIQGEEPIDINPEDPVIDSVKKYLSESKIEGKLKDASNRLDANIPKMGKIYYINQSGKLYFTQDRYNKRVKEPLNNLGLSGLESEISSKLTFDSGGKLINVNQDIAKAVADWITDSSNKDAIKNIDLDKLKTYVREIENPYYSKDNSTFEEVKYTISLEIDGNNFNLTQESPRNERDKIVQALYDFYISLQKPGREFLEKIHTISITIESEAGGIKKGPRTESKIISASVKLSAKIPEDLNKTPEELGIKGVETKDDVETLKKLRDNLVNKLGVTKKQLASGEANVDFTKFKENLGSFTDKELELLKKMF